ncbi:hypothetical protein G6F61_014898 [Rhizopus arrhizus]|nr:hypothetical protein G6F61_014898 [Rhizopus arrhizus]
MRACSRSNETSNVVPMSVTCRPAACTANGRRSLATTKLAWPRSSSTRRPSRVMRTEISLSASRRTTVLSGSVTSRGMPCAAA